jgi:hypothetical protein
MACFHAAMISSLSLQGIRRLDFTFAPRSTLLVQSYPGSAWRGAFGHALKRIVCAMRLRPCHGCALSDVCVHTAFFGPDTVARQAGPTSFVLILRLVTASFVPASPCVYG